MSAVLNAPPLTLEAYMLWEAQQPERHEFVAGEIYAMTGARATHNTIALNVAVTLREILRKNVELQRDHKRVRETDFDEAGGDSIDLA